MPPNDTPFDIPPATENTPSTEPTICCSEGKSCLWHIMVALAVSLGLLAVTFGGLATWAIYSKGPLQENKTIVIPKGTPLYDIAALLDENNIIHDPIAFLMAARLIASNNLQAGEYFFMPELSTAEIVEMLREGKAIYHFITLAEGLTTQEILDVIKSDTTLAGKITVNPTEGSLMPETYRYSYGDTRNGLIERMKKMQSEIVRDLWDKRDKSIPLSSSSEAIILASIVEKETGRKAEERARVAGVFYNRLKIGMRLQSDPTVIYALTQGKKALPRSLLRSDLTTPSSYNTYVNTGLPPSPICNPGRAALEATLHPEKNNFIYFVADGTGGHVFAKELPEHNKNVSNRVKLIKANNKDTAKKETKRK